MSDAAYAQWYDCIDGLEVNDNWRAFLKATAVGRHFKQTITQTRKAIKASRKARAAKLRLAKCLKD